MASDEAAFDLLDTDGSRTRRWSELDVNIRSFTAKAETPLARNRRFESLSLRQSARPPITPDKRLSVGGAYSPRDGWQGSTR
jgi:hypothetical protein